MPEEWTRAHLPWEGSVPFLCRYLSAVMAQKSHRPIFHKQGEGPGKRGLRLSLIVLYVSHSFLDFEGDYFSLFWLSVLDIRSTATPCVFTLSPTTEGQLLQSKMMKVAMSKVHTDPDQDK